MSTVNIFHDAFECDMPGCGAQIEITRPSNEVPNAWLETALRALGWFETKDGSWYCPDCQHVAGEIGRELIQNAG